MVKRALTGKGLDTTSIAALLAGMGLAMGTMWGGHARQPVGRCLPGHINILSFELTNYANLVYLIS
jgi:hypothetical protein